MPTRTFASWVQPIAAVLAEDRLEVINFANSMRPAVWDLRSPVPGWTCRDVLAHLAGGNDQMLQSVLRAVTQRTPLDPALTAVDTDAENARRVEERRRWPVDDLIAELERDSEEVQALLSRLKDSDDGLRQPGFAMTLGEFLRLVRDERHDHLHLEQMRAGGAAGERA